MHAFLFIGRDTLGLKSKVEDLASNLHAKIIEYPLVKIEDVRNLNSLIRLSFDSPTLIYSSDIDRTGEEALNAFLKNLEEPQENIYFALSAPSVRKVLPTIVSRCQIIKTADEKSQDAGNYEEIEQFLKMSEGEKLSYIDKIRDRDKAIEFAENAIAFMHQTLHSDGSLHGKEVEYMGRAEDLKVAIKTLSGLKSNGNVNLHLSNLAINLK